MLSYLGLVVVRTLFSRWLTWGHLKQAGKPCWFHLFLEIHPSYCFFQLWNFSTLWQPALPPLRGKYEAPKKASPDEKEEKELIKNDGVWSCPERGTKKKFWVHWRSRTIDFRIPLFDAPPLSNRSHKVRGKRRKPPREAEWFPSYRVFSQPPKCLHQAM